MKYEDTKKEIIINGKPFLLDSVFSDYATQNIIVTAYESKSDGIGIRLALNWDHYFIYVQLKELNVFIKNVHTFDIDHEHLAVTETLDQEMYYQELDDNEEIKEHVYQYFTDPIEEALYVVL